MSGSESEDGSVISVAGVAEGGLGPVGVGGAAHLVGDLDGDLLAHGPGDLPGVLVGHLVALPVHLLLALGAAGVASVSGLSLGVPLAVTVTVGDNLGVVTNNSGAVVNLLGHGVAVLGDDVLALLGVGGVHDGVVLLVALLVILDIVLGVTMLLVVSILIMTCNKTFKLNINYGVFENVDVVKRRLRFLPPPGAPRAAAAMRARTTNLSILTRVSLPCCLEQKLK